MYGCLYEHFFFWEGTLETERFLYPVSTGLEKGIPINFYFYLSPQDWHKTGFEHKSCYFFLSAYLEIQ